MSVIFKIEVKTKIYNFKETRLKLSSPKQRTKILSLKLWQGLSGLNKDQNFNLKIRTRVSAFKQGLRLFILKRDPKLSTSK